MTGSDVLLQYGAVGALAVLCALAVRVLFGRISTAYDQEKERADRLETQLAALNEAVRNEYVATIAAASRALAESQRAVSDAINAIRRGD